jgi:uncharacterized protein
MSAASDILKHFNLFVDGIGFAGNIEELQLPNLAIVEEEFRAGGMDAPIGLDMGMEKMEATFTLSQFSKDLLKQFGLAEGTDTQVTAKGSLESLAGTKTPVVVAMRGKIKSAEPSSWQGGQKAQWTITVSLRYYRFVQGGETIHEIDVLNMKRVVAGVDQLAEHRRNIGL